MQPHSTPPRLPWQAPEFVDLPDGGRRKLYVKDGYLSFKLDNRTVRYHRWVWEKQHGRLIPPGFIVHHRDHNTLNCEPGNLVAMPLADHIRLHKKTQYGPCAVAECGADARIGGYCRPHYRKIVYRERCDDRREKDKILRAGYYAKQKQDPVWMEKERARNRVRMRTKRAAAAAAATVFACGSSGQTIMPLD